jgi:glutamate racemase
MKANAPIGIFDSGVGGTSIWKKIHQLLPYENTLYLADSKHAPYGHKTKEEIVVLSLKNTQFLVNHGCKIIVVACNTATTNAISVLRARFDVPIIGIEPAIKPAALQTHSKSIGVLATKGTLSSALFHQTSQEFTNGIQLTEIVGEGLVPLIEAGRLNSPEMLELLKKYVRPMVEAKVDHIVLGCSHYPYIIPQLKQLLPEHVKIIDSGEAVARRTQAILEENHLLNSEKSTPSLRFFSNTELDTLASLLEDHDQTIQLTTKEF